MKIPFLKIKSSIIDQWKLGYDYFCPTSRSYSSGYSRLKETFDDFV